MALSLGVNVGSTIKVGADKLNVTDIVMGKYIDLKVGSATVTIPANERVEVWPYVFISMGRSSPSHSRPCLCFEAPKEIAILRT